jgi:hypothetical protein
MLKNDGDKTRRRLKPSAKVTADERLAFFYSRSHGFPA